MMKKNAIAIFDIGKTNKKILLFDDAFRLVHQHEQKFEEILDEDGFSCDDMDKIEIWMKNSLEDLAGSTEYDVKAVNFATYGATLVYTGEKGERLTPAYNYLKPMPEGVLEGFYERYGGIDEFSRKTASPALGMLNSGLQALWLKRKKPEIFGKVRDIMHFPQYLSFLFTRKVVSEYTSIGCHTALWDFDNHVYHKWLKDEGIALPVPISNEHTFPVQVQGKTLQVGIGIHDSSASLAPYIKGNNEKFILISTGTWCIFMNPFNDEPLTAGQLKRDSLCYMSVQQKQVKSSRLFLGHIHEVNAGRLSEHFGVAEDAFKKVKPDEQVLRALTAKADGRRVFFARGVPEGYIDHSVDLSTFASYEEAYHRLVIDLTELAAEAISLIIPAKDESKAVYISGGFARNEIFVRLMAGNLAGKRVFTSEIDNATALGAALVVGRDAFGKEVPAQDLGLKEFKPFGL